MGSAAIAKHRITRLSWPEWCSRLDILLSGAGLTRSKINYPFRSAHFAGLSPAEVAIRVLREGSGEQQERKVNV